jgi:peptidoglycan hydrolase-like protein with peptidoglycan-binding domain
MTWLTFADATRHGFEVRQFDLKAGAEPSPGLPPEPAPTSAPKADIANLLDVQEAAAIQERLRVLGYFSGVKDGLWGPRSRIALRDFKRHNQLPPNDAWDLDTQAALIRAEAVRAGWLYSAGTGVHVGGDFLALPARARNYVSPAQPG